MVEKPKIDGVSTNLAIIGRLVLTPGIFDNTYKTESGVGTEIQLADALTKLDEAYRCTV